MILEHNICIWTGEGGKGRTPVPDCESAKVATLKCGGPPTMPEENRGPWSKKFENRCSIDYIKTIERTEMNIYRVQLLQ